MTEQPKRIYLDACLYIALVRGEDEAPTVSQILRAVESGKSELWASTLIRAEVARTNELVERFLLPPLVRYVDVDLRVAARARQAILDRGIKGADATHLATALQVGCDVFFTKDRKSKLLDADGYQGLRVLPPHPIHVDPQATLDLTDE